MKKTIITILFAGLATLTFSQDNKTSLNKEIVSVDIGFLGTWINYERHLDGLFTLKSAVGLEGGFGQGFISEGKSYFAFTPTIRAEPRYYYNFNRRVKLEKKTSYNAANYFALTVLYVPDLFTISNVPGYEFQSGVALEPKWGIQRTIGKRFNFQFAFGASTYFSKSKTSISPVFDFRFGYNIK